MPDIKQRAHKLFDEKFKCIQSDCDGTGCIPVAKTVGRQISETEDDMVQGAIKVIINHGINAISKKIDFLSEISNTNVKAKK